MQTTIFRTGATLLLLGGLGACGGSGGSSPQGPSTAATPAPRAWTSGTAVSFFSGEDYAPVEGAQVTLGTRQYTTDGAGRIVLAEDAPFGTLVDVVASAFLSRQTSVPSTGAPKFTLWPRETASGMHESFTAQIVYTYAWSDEPEHGTSPLVRLPEGEREVFVWLSGELKNDFIAERTHRDATAEMTAVLDGRAVYSLSPSRPSSGVAFEARLGTYEDGCESGILAFVRASRSTRGEITGGTIFYCDARSAQTSTVLHELGHTVGLQHTYGTNGLMGRNRWRMFYWSGLKGVEHHFSEHEALAMRLLFERPAGNRFPDNDRGVSASSGGVRTIICN